MNKGHNEDGSDTPTRTELNQVIQDGLDEQRALYAKHPSPKSFNKTFRFDLGKPAHREALVGFISELHNQSLPLVDIRQEDLSVWIEL